MKRANDREPVRGESMVWLTGLALALAVVMAVSLVAVILAHGAEVFWPRRVAELTIAQDGAETPVLAQVVKSRDREVGEGAALTLHRELQLFTGNKDVDGMSYRWVDDAAVRGLAFPEDVVVVERLEYGVAIGRPVALVQPGGARIPASDQRFEGALAAAVGAAAGLRERIRELEKERIGDNAEEVQVVERRLRDRPGHRDLTARLAALREEYEVLAAEARTLRGRLGESVLVLGIAGGRQFEIPAGRILHVWDANRAGTAARALETVRRLWAFIAENPREANTEGGIFPAIFGTFVMTLLMSVAVVPFGVLAAIYLREYARQGPLVRAVRIAVNNLAGVPSIVFGVFGLGFLVYFVGGGIDRLLFSDALPNPTFGTGGVLWAALTLALMTVPVVIVATEEAIAAVPRGMREGSLACGASKWQTIQRIVLPASVPGILTGLILAMARGAGEVAPLMMVGVVKLAPSLPLDLDWPFFHLDRKFMHLGFHIYDLGFQSPDSEAAQPMVFATTFLLILLVLILNLGAIIIRDRLRRRFATAAF